MAIVPPRLPGCSTIVSNNKRTEGPVLKKTNPDYTPGKAALDTFYDKTEQFTKTSIPNK